MSALRMILQARANIGWLSLLHLTGILLPLVTLPLVVRAIGADGYGRLAFASAISYFAVLCVDAGFNAAGLRALALPLSTEERRREFWSTQLIRIGIALACALLYALAIVLLRVDAEQTALLAASFLMVLGTLSFPVWAFHGLGQARRMSLLGISGRALTAIALVLLVRAPSDLLLATAIQCGATLLTGLIALPVLFREPALRWYWPGWPALRKRWREGRVFFVSDFLVTAMNNSAVFWLGLFASRESTGLFAACEKLARAIVAGISPLREALMARVVAARAVSPASGRRTAVQLTISLALAAALPVTLLAWQAERVQQLLLGTPPEGGVLVVRCLLAWAWLAIVRHLCAQYLLVAPGFMKLLAQRLYWGAFGLMALMPASVLLDTPSPALAVALAMAAGELLLLLSVVHAACSHPDEDPARENPSRSPA